MRIEDLMLDMIQIKLDRANLEADSHSGDEDSYSIVTGIRDTLQKLHDELTYAVMAHYSHMSHSIPEYSKA